MTKEIKMTFDQKIENLQHQLDTRDQGDSAFKGYVHRQLDLIASNMATKEDVYNVATKADVNKLESRLTVIITKIAEKVGVST